MPHTQQYHRSAPVFPTDSVHVLGYLDSVRAVPVTLVLENSFNEPQHGAAFCAAVYKMLDIPVSSWKLGEQVWFEQV